MELRQLRYLVAVVEEASFTRAAAREHVAQPAVSAQVRRLEAELGQALFARGPGPATLTAAGETRVPPRGGRARAPARARGARRRQRRAERRRRARRAAPRARGGRGRPVR